MSCNVNDNKDPWGRNDTPPEIDEVIKKVIQIGALLPDPKIFPPSFFDNSPDVL